MSLQFIAHKVSVSDIEKRLASLDCEAEVFPIHSDHVGISVPTRLVESVGEHKIRAAMRNIRIYDLYSGAWTA
jgi:hypothetical protein